MKETSWGKVADWYDDLLESDSNTFQKSIILPNLLKLIELKKGELLLDIACGQGFFTREFAKTGADVSAIDISKELIKKASEKNELGIKYSVSPADNLSFGDNFFDKVSMILAIQNVENTQKVFSEVGRVLKKGGKAYFILNHPCFRVPKKSDWGFDNKKGVQYRKIEAYMSDIMTKIDMNPGEKDSKKKKFTISFHKSLQSYFSFFKKAGLVVSDIEEWSSDKKSEPGPRQKAEDRARKEIPLFLLIELVKI